MALGEADTRAKLIDPALHARGWTEDVPGARRELLARLPEGGRSALLIRALEHMTDYDLSDVSVQRRRVKLGEVLRLRKEIVHPHDRPRGRAIFVGLEHLESGSGQRVGSLEVGLASLTGRKPKFYKGDLKAVNPHAKKDEDTRTPGELLDIIEAKGREVSTAIAELRRLL